MADPKNYPFMWTKCSKEEQEGKSNHNYDMDIGLIYFSQTISTTHIFCRVHYNVHNPCHRWQARQNSYVAN